MENLPYKDLSSYLKSLFGIKIQKLTIDAGLSCPNRDTSPDGKGCIYCNEKGSGTDLYKNYSISEQINIQKEKIKRKHKKCKFISYLQSFSNTYASIEKLRQIYYEALNDNEIVGLAIGTRPDLIDNEKLQLISTFKNKYHVWMEYGLQTSNNATLKKINRNHTAEDFLKAVELTEQYEIDVVAHVILGLPGEQKDDMINTAKFLANLNIKGVKIHSLYVSKNTEMYEMYKRGEYICLEREQYIDILCDFISFLPESVIIHRLTGDPHKEELVAPLWTLYKRDNLELIKKYFYTKNSYQGKNYIKTLY